MAGRNRVDVGRAARSYADGHGHAGHLRRPGGSGGRRRSRSTWHRWGAPAGCSGPTWPVSATAPCPKDELAEVLWGDDELPRSWEQMLRGNASKLRASLVGGGCRAGIDRRQRLRRLPGPPARRRRGRCRARRRRTSSGRSRALDAGDADDAAQAATGSRRRRRAGVPARVVGHLGGAAPGGAAGAAPPGAGGRWPRQPVPARCVGGGGGRGRGGDRHRAVPRVGATRC